VEYSGDDGDIADDPIEDRVGGECEYPAPSNVAMDLGKSAGRLGDGLEHGANLQKEPDGHTRINRILPIPTCCLVHVARSGGADLVLQANRRR